MPKQKKKSFKTRQKQEQSRRNRRQVLNSGETTVNVSASEPVLVPFVSPSAVQQNESPMPSSSSIDVFQSVKSYEHVIGNHPNEPDGVQVRNSDKIPISTGPKCTPTTDIPAGSNTSSLRRSLRIASRLAPVPEKSNFPLNPEPSNQNELNRNTKYMRKKRKCPSFVREENKSRNMRRQRQMELHPEIKQKLANQQKLSNLARRKSLAYRTMEARKRYERLIGEFRNDPNKKDAIHKRNAMYKSIRQRNESFYRRSEKLRKAAWLRAQRNMTRQQKSSPGFSGLKTPDTVRKNRINRESGSRRRLIAEYRTPERNQDRIRKAQARKDPVRRKLDFTNAATVTRKKRATSTSSFSRLQDQFRHQIQKGPTSCCLCCGNLLYTESMIQTAITEEKLMSFGWTENEFQKVICLPMEVKSCKTCYGYIKRNKVPRLSLYNGLGFPELPEVLKDLNRLEQRMVSPRIPFMRVQLGGPSKQWLLKGNIVNVENNLDTCVSVLPRRVQECFVIELKLMRKLAYRGHYIHAMITPAKILKALRYLLETPLYKEANITLTEDLDLFEIDGEVPFTTGNTEDELPERENDSDDETDPEDEQNSTNEEPAPIPDETLIYDSDRYSSHVIHFAPAEGNTPIPLNRDQLAERLSFPTIYCGQPEVNPDNVKLSKTDRYKSILRRHDRRGAGPESILYMFKGSFNEKVFNAASIALRQRKRSDMTTVLRAGDLKNPDTINNIVSNNYGYKIFKAIRGTPPYWAEQSKRVVSMVRQLGAATFFITLSAAETKWAELLVILKLFVRVATTKSSC